MKAPSPRRLHNNCSLAASAASSSSAASEGAYVAIAGGKAGWVKPFAVDAIDTVAAGDCFNGAFAVALLEGNDPWPAARFACAASAISVTRRGAQASMPTRADLNAFLAERGETI